jgi:uncharacterized iron-regulated membrane protein
MSTSSSFIKFARLVHLYIGVFISPAVIFFALTGAFQTFQLHLPSKDGHYKPAKYLQVLSQIHRFQTPIPKAKPPVEPATTPAKVQNASAKPKKDAGAGDSESMSLASRDASPPESNHPTLPLKIFFLLVSISLIVSTISGIYMTYKYRRDRLLVGGILLAGVILPVVFTIY